MRKYRYLDDLLEDSDRLYEEHKTRSKAERDQLIQELNDRDDAEDRAIQAQYERIYGGAA